MPEAMQQQTNSKADDECGTVINWSSRYGFVRPDGGGSDVYLGAAQLVRAGIERLKIGDRIRFEVRPGTDGRKRWAAKIRLVEPPA
jgi:cold shock CspA family protein